MTDKVDLQEFRAAYLAEADEQLGVANAKLLAIEEALKRGENDPRSVRDLFRALHTIKGLSSMIGVEPVVAIAHRMETVLRASDRAGGKLPVAAVERLLDGTRAIERCVRALAADKEIPTPSAALLERHADESDRHEGERREIAAGYRDASLRSVWHRKRRRRCTHRGSSVPLIGACCLPVESRLMEVDAYRAASPRPGYAEVAPPRPPVRGRVVLSLLLPGLIATSARPDLSARTSGLGVAPLRAQKEKTPRRTIEGFRGASPTGFEPVLAA